MAGMDNHVEYSKLSVLELDDGEDDAEVTVSFRAPAPIAIHSALDESSDDLDIPGGRGKFNNAIRNEYPFPISRRPSKQRDWVYGLAFLVHFLVVLLVSFIEQGSLQHAAISYNRAGSWASMVMITTLIGGLLGGMAAIALVLYEGRALVLQCSITFSLILKILMGNIMFIMRSPFSFLGIFIVGAAVWDGLRFKAAKKSLPFSATLIQMISNLSRSYGIWLAVTCGIIVAAQTLVLLWWGAFFIGAISTISEAYIWIISALLLFSLYWISQFFQLMLSFVIGGSVLWLFIQDEGNTNGTNSLRSNSSDLHHNSSGAISNTASNPTVSSSSAASAKQDATTAKLGLYLQCALTTSFGSLCKGAIFMGPSQALLQGRYLFFKHQHRLPCLCKCVGHNFDRVCCACMYPFARHYHRLSLCLLAVYGRTLVRTAEDQMQYHPETLNSSLEETTGYTLDCLSTCIAGSVSILFGLLAERRETSTWPLFIFVCFWLSYAGAALALSAYSSAVDALIVATALNPQKVAQENQIVLLRFLRTAETESV